MFVDELRCLSGVGCRANGETMTNAKKLRGLSDACNVKKESAESIYDKLTKDMSIFAQLGKTSHTFVAVHGSRRAEVLLEIEDLLYKDGYVVHRENNSTSTYLEISW